MTWLPGAGRETPLAVLAVGLALWFASAVALARQDAPSSAVEIGAGPVREPALALVGRTTYGADSATMSGYLTAVIGLDPALLFSDAPPSAQTARFTYAGDVSLSASSGANRGDVTGFDGAGVLRIYFDDDAGAAWDDPDSFADGQPVAEFSIAMRDTLQRQAPGVGIVVGDERLEQVMAGELTIDGAPYRFGQTGIEARLRSAGALTGGEMEQSSPDLVVNLTGSISVTARETVPVRMGSPTN